MTDRVRVYVVTYRRPALLERALRSLVAQIHTNWVAEVLNDDPADERVPELIHRLGDGRILLSQPQEHRGGTRNFNRAFREAHEPLASILEDDNWWAPEFLSEMAAALRRNPGAALACANERIWAELAGGGWTDLGATAWPETEGERLVGWDPIDACGGARLCNSSLLFRTEGSGAWRTPDTIPLDVTEHFRERVVPHPLLLVNRPLAHFSRTLSTSRTAQVGIWAKYQLLLVGSVFALADPGARRALAATLWGRARASEPLLRATLLATGFFVPEARPLWDLARPLERVRFAASLARRPGVALSLRGARRRLSGEWRWLLQGAFAEYMRASAPLANA